MPVAEATPRYDICGSSFNALIASNVPVNRSRARSSCTDSTVARSSATLASPGPGKASGVPNVFVHSARTVFVATAPGITYAGPAETAYHLSPGVFVVSEPRQTTSTHQPLNSATSGSISPRDDTSVDTSTRWPAVQT